MADLSLDSLVGGSGNLQTGAVVTDYNSTLEDGTSLYPLDGSLISRSTNPVLSTKFPFVYGQDMQKIDLGITTGSNSAWLSDNQGAAASSGDNILLGVDGTYNHQSIIYSSDAGVTWSYAFDATANVGGGLKLVLDGTYGAFSLNTSTSNSHFGFSSDSGASFTFITTGVSSIPLDLAIDTTAGYMLIAFENGVIGRITNLASPSVSTA